MQRIIADVQPGWYNNILNKHLLNSLIISNIASNIASKKIQRNMKP